MFIFLNFLGTGRRQDDHQAGDRVRPGEAVRNREADARSDCARRDGGGGARLRRARRPAGAHLSRQAHQRLSDADARLVRHRQQSHHSSDARHRAALAPQPHHAGARRRHRRQCRVSATGRLVRPSTHTIHTSS